jgi:MFS family permease
MFGRSRVLMIILAIAAAGSVLGAVSTKLEWIIVGRAIQGTAGAVLPLCYGLAREHLPSRQLPFGLAAITGVGSLGAAGGFLIGGLIVDHWHWQHIFTVSAALAAATLILCLLWLPRSQVARTVGVGRDLLGGVLFAPGIALVLLAISQKSSPAHALGPTALFAAGVVVLLVWVLHELRQTNPLIDIRLLAMRPVALANMNALLLSMGAFQVMQIFPILIQQPAWTGIGFGLSATMTGLLKLPSNVTSALGAVAAGKLAGSRGGQGAILAGTAVTLLAWIGLYFCHDQLWLIVLFVCASSSGVVMALTGTVAVVVNHVPTERTSEATGVTVVIRTTFQAVGALIIAKLLTMNPIEAHGARGAYLSPSAVMASIGYVAIMSAAALANAQMMWRSAKLPRSETSLAVDQIGSQAKTSADMSRG